MLKYLAPYVNRVAISDSRIVSIDDQQVVYKVKPSGKQHYETHQLSGEAFVGAFAQHILPSGLQKIRYYGFMSPNSRLQLEDVRWLVWMWKGWTYWLGSAMFQPVIKSRFPLAQNAAASLSCCSSPMSNSE